MTDQREVQTETSGYPTAGDVLDERYRLEQIINSGGMGVIMRARQLTMDRDVAVKLLLPNKAAREATRTRFEREVHLAKQLTHPNIIRFYDYGHHGPFLYIIMELLEGQDLKDLLRREGPLPVSRALDIAVQATDALTDAHSRNIVHRDLKPANLFIQRLGSHRDFVKVLDFGIAKSLDSREFDVTSTGEVSGTLAYLSPESVRGKVPGKAADVYALGVIMVEMITGRKIYEGQTVAETLMNQMQRPLVLPPSIANTALAGVLDKALTKNPAERFGDAGELLDGLNRVVPTVSPTLRVSAQEVEKTYGPLVRMDGLSSSDLVPRPNDSNTPIARTRVGYAKAEEAATAIIDPDSQEVVSQAARSNTSDTPTASLSDASRRRVVPFLIGLVAVGALFAVGGDWVWQQVRRPAPTTESPQRITPPPPEKPSGVLLESDPTGAEVLRAGKRVGVTPVVLAAEKRTAYELRKEEHETQTVVIDPSSDEEVSVALTKAEAPVDNTEVAVDSAVATVAIATFDADDTAREKAVAARAASPTDRKRERRPSRPREQSKQKSEPTDESVSQTAQPNTPTEPAENLDIFENVKAAPTEPQKPAEKTADELHAEARKAFIAGDYSGCVSSCEKGLRKGAEQCHSLLANAHRQLGDMKSACRHYKAAGIAHKACITLQSR